MNSKLAGCSNGGPSGGLAHRSISPKTMSIEPMIATRSASMWPRHMKSVACRKAKPGALILQRYGRLVPSDDEVDAELALRRLDRRVGLAGRHVVALGVELEMMDQRFHRMLHLGARRRRHLAVVDLDRPGRHLRERLADDAHRLAHLLDAHEVAVVAIAVAADRHVEIHLVVGVVGLRPAQIPGRRRRPRSIGPEKPQSAASSALTMPISTVRCLKMRLSVSSRSMSSIVFGKVSQKARMSSARPAGRSMMDAAGAEIIGVEPCARRRARRTPSAARVPRSPRGTA